MQGKRDKKKKFLAILAAIAMTVQVIVPAGSVSAAASDTGGTEKAAETRSEETVINVLDYGAQPAGKGDSTVAVQNALEAAKEIEGPVRLYFPEGEYHFYKDFASQREWHTSNTSSLSNPTKWIGILIEGQEELTIDGGGSTFMMHGDIMAIAVAKSSGVTLENFSLDYEVPDTMDMTIVGKGTDEDGKSYTDMYIPANYQYEITADEQHINWMSEVSPFTGERYWQDTDTLGAYLVIYKGYDETVRRHNSTISYEGSTEKDADPFVGVESIREVGSNIVRFTYKNRVPEAQEVGNVYLLCDSTRRRTCGAFIWESEDTLVTDLDVHYLSGFGWLTQMSTNTEFNNVNFLPREGTGKYTTSNADQIHVSGAGGYFNVINCNFSMAHDDPINIHGTYLRVEEVIDSHTLRLKYIHSQQGGYPAYFPGDQVTFYSRTNLEVPTGMKDGDTFEVKSAINPGETYEGETLSMRETVVTFTEDFPESVLNCLKVKIKRGSDPNANVDEEPLYVAENVTYTPSVLIKGNTMRSIPTRGILCTTRKEVVIEDNIFEDLAMASIYLSNDADYWYESGPIRNMTIRNNTFNVSVTGQTEWSTVSPVFVDPVIVTSAVAAPGYELPESNGDPVHKNITVEGNTFNMSAFNLVSATGVEGFTFQNNTINRDTSLEVGLTADKTQLQVGETAALSAQVTEDLLKTDAFIFKDCKDVVIKNNTYDDGMNMNVKLSGDMEKSDVTVEGDALTIGGSENLTTSASKVQYISLNPDIVKIEKSGQATALKAGTASVLAYCRWKNSIVRSELLTLTVSGEAEQGTLAITGESLIEEKDGSIQLSVSGGETASAYTWSVTDAFTDEATDAAVISDDGVLTGRKDGIVKVSVQSGAMSAEKLVVISLPVSYGIKGGTNNNLADEVEILNENEENWQGTGEEDAIQIIGEWGDLYNTNNATKNIITYQIPEDVPKDDLRVQVTVDGLPKSGENWNAAGLMLFNDADNYIRVGTKGHMGYGIATDVEINASDAEAVKGSTLAGKKAILEISRVGSVTTMRYKDLTAGSDWSESYELATEDSLGSDYCVALCAWNKDDIDITASFSGLKIAKASEVSTEELEQQSGKALFIGAANEAPTVSDCQVTGELVNGGKAEVSYTYADAEGYSQESALYHWICVSDEGTRESYTTVPELNLEYTGDYTCEIYVTDAYQKPCKTPGTVKFTVGESDAQDIQVTKIEINGNTLLGFDADTTEYEYAYPAEADQMYVRATCKNDSYGSVKLTDAAGKELAAQGEAFSIPDDGIVKLVRTGEAGEQIVYTIAMVPYGGSDSGISNIRIGDVACSLIKEGTNGYFAALGNEDNVVSLSFTVADGVKSVKVNRSFYRTEIEGALEGTSYRTEDVDLYSGLNIFHVSVEADDGSLSEYTIQVFRSGYSDCDAEDITLNGKTLDGFDNDTTDYMIYLDEEEAKNLTLEAQTEDGKDISVIMYYEGERIEGSSMKIASMDAGKHTALITVRSENQWTEKIYEVVFIVEEDSNNSLLELKSSLPLSPVFDEDVTEYTASTNSDTVTIQAVSQHREATVSIESLGKKEQGVHAAQSEIKLYEGLNKINIRVTAPDQTEKVYRIWITANGCEYLSDLEADSISNGYGVLKYDHSISGGTIMVCDENGSAVSYKKGIGGHAPSEFVYTVAGKGYTTFEAVVGIDYVQYSTNLSSVNFLVYLDDSDTPVWESGEMGSQTPAKKISVDLTGASKLRLVTDDCGGNGYDHTDWADAKFLKPLDTSPVVQVTGISVAPESVSLKGGESAVLTAEVLPEDATETGVIWTSADETIASVSADGTVTALKTGTVTITAASKEDDTMKASCIVTVTSDMAESVKPSTGDNPANQTVKVQQITLNTQKSSIAMGTKVTLSPVISPANATNKKLLYSSSNTSVAVVSASGVVTAKKVGTVTITVSSADGGAKAGWTFNVVPKKTKITTAKRTTSSSAKLKWKKVAGATGYKIYVSTKKNGKYKLKATVKKAKTVSKVIKKLKANKTYYFKVAAYKKVSGKTYVGELSAAKVVKKKK